ncbi:unnamed protein product [Ectocarpus sp. 4 AP-2014]
MIVSFGQVSLYTQGTNGYFFVVFAQGRPSRYYPLNHQLLLLVRRVPWTRGEGFSLNGFGSRESLDGDPCSDAEPRIVSELVVRTKVSPGLSLRPTFATGLLCYPPHVYSAEP